MKRRNKIELYDIAEKIAQHNVATLSKQAPQTLYLAARIAKKLLLNAKGKNQ